MARDRAADDSAKAGRRRASSPGRRDRSVAPTTGGPTTLLTSRQRQVATLIGRGYSNQQIAQELVLTRGTVANHVRAILQRLDLRSRGQVTAWAIEHGLTTTQDRLLTVLEHLLEIEAPTLSGAMDQAAQLVADALGCDKVDAFLHEPFSATLVALGTSDTPMGRKERALGLDRLPIADGGCAVRVFQSGIAQRDGRVDQDPAEPIGIRRDLGVCSVVAVPLEVAGTVRGVLMAASASPEFFTPRDLDFLQAVSRWVGSLAHRAELLEQTAATAVEQGRRAAADEARREAEAARDAAQRSQALAEAALRDAETAQRSLLSFLAMVAHDLRTPLTALSGFAQLLARPNIAPDVHDRAVATIQANARDMERLIADIVEAGRLGAGSFTVRPAPMDLVALVRQVVEAQQATTGGHRLVLEAPTQLRGEWDAGRLGQVLANLVANAIKYSPDGGDIRVTVRQEGEEAVVGVADQGIGIRAEDLPWLFQPFARVDGEQGPSGAGLGLYISHGIVEAHRGRLWAASPGPGQGSTFTCALPLSGSS